VYKILGTDKKEYGPVSAEMLQQWIADRRVNSQTLIQAEGSTDWRPLSQFPQFTDLAQVPPAPASASAPVAPATSSVATPSTPPKTSAMAITSLILGILGLISCGITAVVGLILGIVSLIKVRNSNGQLSGTGIAIAGICVSGVLMLLALPISAGLLLPALAKAKDRAQRIQCMNNLKQIGLSARLWANDHGGAEPPNLIALSNHLASPKLLVCPGEKLRDRSQAPYLGGAFIDREQLRLLWGQRR